MRHHAKGRKFGRKTDQRRAFLKNLAANLILKEKIKTTEARAKEIKSYIERLITKSKINNLATVRYLAELLPPKARTKLISQIGPRFSSRLGGYTRIVKIGLRKGDRAKMAIIELIK